MQTSVSAAVQFTRTDNSVTCLDIEFMRLAAKVLALFPNLSETEIATCAQRAAGATVEFLKYAELARTRDTLIKEGGAIAVFGSARPKATDTNPVRQLSYQHALELGELITKTTLPIDSKGTLGDGASVATGAGPGLMEASVTRADGRVHGHAIIVPHENGANQFVPKERLQMYDQYTFRKLGLIEESRAFVNLPGGFGTLEENAEVLNLMASGTISMLPVVFLGKKFWEPIVSAITTNDCLPQSIRRATFIVDSPQEAVDRISSWHKENPPTQTFKPYRMLENCGARSAINLRKKDLEKVPERLDTLKVLEDYRAILKESMKPALGRLITGQEVTDTTSALLERGEPAVYGFLKWFSDRLILECEFQDAGIDKFTMLIGDPNQRELQRGAEALLASGKTVVHRLSREQRTVLGEKVGKNVPSGLQVIRPGKPPITIPVFYRDNAWTMVFDPSRLEQVVVLEQGLRPKDLEKVFIALCWRQTGKIGADVPVSSYHRNKSEHGEPRLSNILAVIIEQAKEGEFISSKDCDPLNNLDTSLFFRR